MTRIRESVPKKLALTMSASVVVAVGTLWACGNARADTGDTPLLDNLCYVPAFAQGTPIATVNGNKVQHNTIGLRAHNDYCINDAVPPPDYGSGPPVLVVP